MVKGFWDFWNHMSHTSIRKFKNLQMFCNHHKEGKGKVHRHTDLSNLQNRWIAGASLHTHTCQGRTRTSEARGTSALVFLRVFSPHSYGWQCNRPFEKSRFFLPKEIWELERNSQPDDLGSSFILAASFLHHHGQTTSPLSISSPFLWNEWMGTGLKGLLQLKTSCNYFEGHVPPIYQGHIHLFLSAAPFFSIELHGIVGWSLALDKVGLKTNLHPTH